MPVNIRCRACDTVVLGFEAPSLRPVAGDACPDCGGSDFERAD